MMSRFLPCSLLLCTSLAFTAGCSEDSSPPPPVGGTDSSNVTVTASGTGTGTGSTGVDDTAEGSTSDTNPPTSCDEIMCQGNSSCLIEDGIAGCYCDQGYVLDEQTMSECVVDTSCIQLRFLEDYCRLTVNGPPAVTLFFAVDYCSGTAVLPEDLEAQGLSFQVFENGIDIAENVESFATVIPTEVESYVTLVLDVSDSVTGTEDQPSAELPQLVGVLRDFVQRVAPAPGEPDVYLSIYVFGRFVREYVPFTRDYAAVDAAIADIEANPLAINALVNGDGTRLYDAVKMGINRTQRIRDLRDAVTKGGVLSTGSVVVITDGLESTNGTLDTPLINSTLNQVISIGIGEEVAANDEDLTRIGRDGSFLAPTPADLSEAFDLVISRVEQYPERAYLLGYCTSAAQDVADVEVRLAGDVTLAQTATCSFDASAFSVDPEDVCSADLFVTECDSRECGGLTACGACADDQCCAAGQCGAPTTATAAGLDCEDSDQLCNATSQICVEGAGISDPSTCENPSGLGALCDIGCEPGVGYCDEVMGVPTCVAAMPTDPNGPNCAAAEQCQSLNCRSANPDNDLLLPTCLPPAQLYDACGVPGDTVCEDGGFCSGSLCLPQRFDLQNCSSADQCRSGLCVAPVNANVCLGSGACYWAWDEKMPG